MARIGEYTLERKLGEGPSAEVFLCRDAAGAEVAVKRFRPGKMPAAAVALAGRLAHPHIAALQRAVIEGDASYFVSEYVPGGSLEQFCWPQNLLAVDKIVEIAFKCTRALAYAQQQGISHGDLKPSNVLLADATEAKLADFGCATLEAPAYLAPEQTAGAAPEARGDIYSLGVTMYHLLTGVMPYQASSNESLIYQIRRYEPPLPSTHRKEVPMAVDKIVRRAMQKEPAKRYASWEEFARDLAAVFRGERTARR